MTGRDAITTTRCGSVGAEPEYKYDVFISYSRRDGDWVRSELYEKLSRCRISSGLRARVFFDTSKIGIQPGQDFLEAIGDAILNSRWFVPVYSSTYLKSIYGKAELNVAFVESDSRKGSFVVPVNLDPQLKPPTMLSTLHYLSVVEHDDWFQRLCDVLGLHVTEDRLRLEFMDQPPEHVRVNHTLAPIHVVARDEAGRPHSTDAEFGISGPVMLQGSVTVKSTNGVAEFADLSIGEAKTGVRLEVTSPGIDGARSSPFDVLEEESITLVPGQAIVAHGQPVFFADGDTLAVIGPDTVTLHGLDGNPLSTTGISHSGYVRLIRRVGHSLVVAAWTGEIVHVRADGWHQRFVLEPRPFQVPGDVDLDGDVPLVGFWSGSVHRLEASAGMQRVFRHPGGVQAMTMAGESCFVCDFLGRLNIYQGGRLRRTVAESLEPIVWCIKSYDKSVIAVGEKRLYHFSLENKRLISDEPPLDRIVAVLEDPEMPILVDAGGKCAQVGADLTFVKVSRVPAGAVPLDADRSGNVCVFQNPDGSKTLRVWDDRSNRAVFSKRSGALAVSPDGQTIAIEEESGIRLVRRADLVKQEPA